MTQDSTNMGIIKKGDTYHISLIYNCLSVYFNVAIVKDIHSKRPPLSHHKLNACVEEVYVPHRHANQFDVPCE